MIELDNDCKKQSKCRYEWINLDMSNLLFILPSITLLKNIRELNSLTFLLYLKKMFTVQRILYVHLCLQQKLWEKCLPEENELCLLLVMCGDVERRLESAESNI